MDRTAGVTVRLRRVAAGGGFSGAEGGAVVLRVAVPAEGEFGGAGPDILISHIVALPDGGGPVAGEIAERAMRPHHPGDGVHVGDGDMAQPQLRRPARHFLRVRGAGEEGEIGQGGEFGDGHGGCCGV